MEVEPEKIKKTNRKEIAGKIEALLQIIDKKPKSFGWKTRARVGTKKIWCEHVERPETAGGFGIWGAILKEESL